MMLILLELLLSLPQIIAGYYEHKRKRKRKRKR